MSIKNRPWFSVAYMFALTAAASVMLIGLSRLTRERVEANEKLAFEKAVLACLAVAVPEGASNLDLHRLYVELVREPDEASHGAYRLMKDGAVAAFALPFEGQGFWNPIRGVIGIAADRETVTGIAFYEQSETPGLGAEIVKPRFRKQFAAGKKLAPSEMPLAFRPETEQAGASEVNALTGATQTCSRLERMLNERLARWREARKDTEEK